MTMSHENSVRQPIEKSLHQFSNIANLIPGKL